MPRLVPAAAACLVFAAAALAQNDDCTNASPVGALPGLAAGSTAGANADSAAGCGVRVQGPGVWYSVTGTGNAITATTCGLVAAGASAAFDSRINVYAGQCGSLACIASSDDHGGCTGGQSTVTWCSEPATTYLILVHNVEDDDGAFTLAVIEAGDCAPPANNDCAAAAAIQVNTPVAGTTVWADGGNPSQAGCPRHDRDVWYTFAPIPEQEYTVTVTGALANTSVSLFAGCGGSEIENPDGSGRSLCRDLPGTNDTQTVVFAVSEDVPVIAIRIASGPEATGTNAGSGDDIGGDFTIEVQANLPTGACCTPSGCLVMTQPQCAGAGGSYLGDGAACIDAGPAGEPQAFGPRTPNLPINDFETVSDTLTVIGVNGPVGAVTVTVDITHNWIEDLAITLTHEASGTTVTLLEADCPATLDVVATFSDNGAELECESPLSGTFAPRQPLATFNGLAADGAWTLRVADEATFGNGTFNSWSITIDQQVPGSCDGASSCPCEFDGNEGINVFDLLAYLDLWFAGDEGAEFDGQDGINVFDLLGFLDCWFQGC